MTEPQLAPETLTRVRSMWAGKAGAKSLPGAHDVIVVNADSNICRPGWAGIVMLDGAAIAVAPTEKDVDAVQACIDRARVDGLAAVLADATDLIGPADLAYLDSASFRLPGVQVKTEWLSRTDARVEVMCAAVDPEELGEAGGLAVDELACALDGDTVTAAAGYEVWDGGIAHLDVLTAPTHRGLGLGKRVSSVAVQRAFDAGLIPQWRARPAASKGIARALGFVPVGEQASFRLASFDR